MLVEKIELAPDEQIISLTRRHWFVLSTQLAGPVFLALVPLGAFVLITIPSIAAYIPEIPLAAPLAAFGYAVWLLIVWMLAFSIWTNYYLDTLILTNERIIMVDQKGLFHRTVASFRLERMQDMNVDVNGILATFFDYGTVHAETAGHSEEEFRVYGMPHPRDLKAEILKATDAMIDAYRARPRMSGDEV